MSGAMQFAIRLNVDGAAAAVTAVTSVGDAAQGASAKVRAAGEAAAAGGLAQAKALEDLRLAYDDGYAAQSRYAAAQQQVIDLFQAGAINARQLETYLAKAAAAYDPVAVKARGEAAALAALEARLDPVSAKTRQLAADQALLDAALAKGQITAARHGELTAGIRGQQAALTGAQGAVKDYGRALQALGPQVADVGVTLAMGMNPLMVAVQQGPQIVEMLAMAGAGARAAAASFLAMAAPVVLVGGALALATARAASNTQALREFDVQLRATGRVGNATAAELQAVARELYALGASKDEAAAAINAALASRKFAGADQIREIGALAIDASAGLKGLVTGFDDAGAAAKTLTDWLAGGVKGLREASDATGALTVQQYEAARAAYEAGDKARAQAILMEALRGRYQGLARDGLSPAAAAMRDVSRAWDKFVDALANNDAAVGSLRLLAGLLERVAAAAKAIQEFSDNPLGYEFPTLGLRKVFGGADQPPPPTGPQSPPSPHQPSASAASPPAEDPAAANRVRELARANDRLAEAYKKTGAARQIALAQMEAERAATEQNLEGETRAKFIQESVRKARIEATGAIADQSAALKAYSRAAAEGAAAVLGGAREDLVYWKALSAAMQDAVSSGADPYAAAARELAKQAADAAMAGAAQVKEMEAATAATAAQADAALVSAAAEEQAALKVKIYNETLAERSLLQYADADAAAALAEVIGRKIAALESEAAAQKRLDLARDIRGQRDQLTVMQAEIRLMGAGAAARTVEMARIKALIDLKNKNIDTSSREAQEYLANAEALARTDMELERVQSAYQELGDFGEKAFDAVINKMTEAGDKGLRLKDIATAIGAEFQMLALKMTLINPAKNFLTGGNLPTVFDLFSGGGASTAAQAQQQGGGLGSTGNLLSLGSKFVPSSWTSGIGSTIDMWGYSALGVGTPLYGTAGMTAAGGGLAQSLGVAAMPGGVTNVAAAPTVTGVSAGTGLTAYLGSAGVGALGGMLGGMLGTAANSKAVGALSGAALGAGGAGLASYLGMSAAGGPVGLAIGAVAGALMGALGASKKPKTEASAYANMGAGGVITGADTGSRYQDAGPVIAARDAVTTSVQALVTAGATFDGISVNVRAMGDRWETWSQGFDGYRVSTSDDPATIIRDYVRWASSDAADVLGKGRPALGLSDIGRRAAATATTTGEDYIATVALAEQVAAGAAALQDFDKSLAGIEAAAKKAAAEGFAPLTAELSKASDGGFAVEYRNLLSGQMRQMLDQMAAPVEYSALEQAMASAAGEMAALRQASIDLGLGLEGAVDAAQAAVKGRLLGQANDEIAAAIDEAAGRGHRNSAREIVAEYEATARTLAALGGDGARALDLAGAKLTALLGGLDDAAALDAISVLTGDLAALGAAALATAQGTRAAAAAQEAAAAAAAAKSDLASRYLSAQSALDPVGAARTRLADIAMQATADAAINVAQANLVARAGVLAAVKDLDSSQLGRLVQVYRDVPSIAGYLSDALSDLSGAGKAATDRTAALAAAETALIDVRKAQQSAYLSALTAQAQGYRQAASAARSLGAAMAALPGKLALDKDLSILDPAGRLDEAWRQLSTQLTTSVSGITADMVAGLRAGSTDAAAQIDALLSSSGVDAQTASGLDALIETTLTQARGYYSDLSAYGVEYSALTSLSAKVAAAATKTASRYDNEANAVDRHIVALGGTATAADALTSGLSSTNAALDALRHAANDAAAKWQGGQKQDFGDANVSASNQIIAAAAAASGHAYAGAFRGGAFRDFSNSIYSGYQVGDWDAWGGDLSNMLRLVTGYQGDFVGGAFPEYAKSGTISEIQKQAARELLLRYNMIPTFAAGGDHGGGLRLVGEMGPELEVTGAARIHNAAQTQQILRGAMAPDMGPVVTAISAGAAITVRAIEASAGRVVGAIDGLGDEVARLHRVIADQGREIARLTAIVGRLAA